jgi:ribosome maturation factor RimP
MKEPEGLSADIEALLAGQGLNLLELTVGRHHGSVQVRAVVHSSAGTGTAECVKAHKLIAARLAEGFGLEEPFIEVASPGIDRQFRSRGEYGFFAGHRIRLLLEGESEWTRGRLLVLEGEEVMLETRGGKVAIPLASIVRARLDSTPEGD